MKRSFHWDMETGARLLDTSVQQLGGVALSGAAIEAPSKASATATVAKDGDMVLVTCPLSRQLEVFLSPPHLTQQRSVAVSTTAHALVAFDNSGQFMLYRLSM